MRTAALLLLLLLMGGCAHGGWLRPTVVAAPILPHIEPPKAEPLKFEPLAVCFGGNFLDTVGTYTNGSWAFSWAACVMEV